MIMCFILAMAVLIGTVITTIKLIKRKSKLDTIVFTVAIACFLQMLILTIGLADTEKNNASDILAAIGASIKAMGGEANTEFIDRFTKENLFDHIYCEWLYAIWFISPIAAGGVLISTLNKINSLFTKKAIKKEHICIFTELTDETLITATTKYNNAPSGRERKALFFVFLKGDAELLKGAGIPAIITPGSLADIKFNQKTVKHIEIWDFCFDAVIRTNEIIEFVGKYAALENIKLTLNIFDTDSVSEKRYKSMISKYFSNNNISIFISDTYKSTAHSILRSYPLYNYVDESADEVNILVIGMGKFGYQFIGNMFGSCQFLSKGGNAVKLRVTAIDKNANAIRDRRLMESPDFITTLEKEGLLKIENYDIESAAIRSVLDNMQKPDYCVVATNDDEINIRTTKFLKRYFIRDIIHKNNMPDNSDKLYKLIPPIIVKIRDGKKSDFIFTDDDDERIIPFGSIQTVYDHGNLSTNDISLISKKLYAINCNSNSSDHEKSFAELTVKFSEHAEKHASKYDIDSTNEEAICLRYLIHGCTHPDKEAMLRYIENPTCIFTSADDDFYFRSENQKELSALVDLLHERWRYYTLYSGFSCPSQEDYMVYEAYNKKLGISSVHKFVPAHYNNLLKPANELSKRSDCDYMKIKLMTYITRP